jgi:sugar phosphate isomerase/epimerase
MKDMDATAERGMTEVGEGTIDFGAIVSDARAAGIRHWFVEHDRPAEPMESIRTSYEGMSRLLGG